MTDEQNKIHEEDLTKTLARKSINKGKVLTRAAAQSWREALSLMDSEKAAHIEKIARWPIPAGKKQAAKPKSKKSALRLIFGS